MENKENLDTKKCWSRREVIINTSILATGIVAAGTLAGCSSAAETNNPNVPTTELKLPLKIAKLDVEKVRKRAYEGYYEAGCSFGAATALIQGFRDAVGEEWNMIPAQLWQWGEAGGVGWGTICGSLNGAMGVLSLAVENYDEIGNEVIGWYTLQPFPSEKNDSFAKIKGQITTVSDSPLCHVSVSKWVNEAGVKMGSDERKERCGKLTADVAAYTAELINQQIDGNFKPTFKMPEAYASCVSCHVGSKSMKDNAKGVQNCVSCHEPHM